MSFVIYKYPLNLTDEQTVELPRGSDIIQVGCQGNDLFLWALQSKDLVPYERRTILIYGTGHEIPTLRNIKYIETVIDADHFVWHVFEKTYAEEGK